jgi:tight adherence protein B
MPDVTLFLPLAAAVLTALTVLTLLVGVRGLVRRDADISARMNTYLGGQETSGAIPADPQLAQRLNETIQRQGFAANVERNLAAANLPLTVPEYILLRAAIPLVLALVVLLVWREPLLVPLGLFAGFVAPIFWLRMRRTGRNRDFNDQLPETLDLITAAMKGGFSLVQSLAYVANDSPEPTRTELRRVFQEVQLGLNVSTALDNLVARMESEDLDLVVTAIKIHARVGGNLTTVLENISTTIRERAKLKREVRVITSMQRISSYVIGGLPFALGGIIFSINPEYMSKMFEPGLTLCIPIGAFISAVVGFLVIQRIVDIKV